VHLNHFQKNHDVNLNDRIAGAERHMGDVTLVKGDENGKASMTRYDL
jgi:hypothetical protein